MKQEKFSAERNVELNRIFSFKGIKETNVRKYEKGRKLNSSISGLTSQSASISSKSYFIMSIQSWQEIAAEKQKQREEKIPEKWRIRAELLPNEETQDIQNWPHSSGFFTLEELSITESTATEVVQNIAKDNGRPQMMQAVCKRASITQQLLNCVTEIYFEEAMKHAEELDQYFAGEGKTVGALHGFPITFKDQFNLKGVDTSVGYISWANKPATEDSTLVTLLSQAGAIPFVKTNIPATLIMGESVNNFFGRTQNPRNRELTTGGSSGGESELVTFRGSFMGVLPRKLCFGIAYGDGRVNCTPSLRRAFDITKKALIVAGHEVIELIPEEHIEAAEIITKMWSADGGVFPVTQVDQEKDVIPSDWKRISDLDKKVTEYYGHPKNHENIIRHLLINSKLSSTPRPKMRVSIGGKGVLQGATILDTKTRVPICYRFSSVPYASPPIGRRRWCKPESLLSTFSYGSDLEPGQFTKPCTPCPQISDFGAIPNTSEDCLKFNIYVPVGKPPAKGWPVLFWIHGGFLQFGSNNTDNPAELIGKTNVKCIVISPGYRLGVFGFLASKRLLNAGVVPNVGFWDQRFALEWTYDNIQYFGGNKENITVGGLSAGAYSAFYQLAYDIGPNCNRQIIRRVLQFSNGCGVEPKSILEAEHHVQDFLKELGIPDSLRDLELSAILHKKSSKDLIQGVSQIKQKFFRPVMDREFISEFLFKDIYDGSFGRRMYDLDIQIMIGDLTQEHYIYAKFYPPKSYEELVDRLAWDYPRYIATAISQPYRNSQKLSSDSDWAQLFGKVYADMQIHSTMRGFIQSISKGLPLSHIHRYKIDWRTESVDQKVPREQGATHATDLSIWIYGNGDSLTVKEEGIIKEWLRPLASFLKGESVKWGTGSVGDVKYLSASGRTEVRTDEVWDEKIQLWDLTKRITRSQKSVPQMAKL
ncbi:hypothetical protein G7Y89_g14815 [Cudoniella acicularis]|uniref:Carboxylesterase type B domain-containing protein n=1 Tax=Cudoniella acicularis TaxID=354080 RepID=A0A8H4VR56_9HELO|nr:hypothetical protein G7Y89_g14815 [Cudoniella acicularis]